MYGDKTLKLRPLTTTSHERHNYPMIQLAANNPAIPLQDEDWLERWCSMPKTFEDYGEKVLDFKVRPEDVFVVTFMKCGTTWMQETAWLLMNHLDYETARKDYILNRSIFIDMAGLYERHKIDSIDECNKMPNPRLIKSHMPANLLPRQMWEKKQKTIYVARNVKDVVVSSFHFVKGLGTWNGSLDDYVNDFMKSEIMFTPFWAHIVDFWKMRHEPFIFFTTYEEMKRDLAGVIKKLCTFLERPQLNEDELKRLVDHLSFEKMKDNQSTNLTTHLFRDFPTNVNKNFQFMRKGKVGSYKEELTAEHERRIDEWSNAFLARHGIKQEDIFGKM